MNTPLFRSLGAGLIGFVAYGGWAWYANMAHGDAVAMRSGLVQGVYSLVLTFVTTMLTEALYARTRQALLTVGVVSIGLSVGSWFVHMLFGTPEILMTILPGFVIGTAYTAVYVAGLRRAMLVTEIG